MSISLHSHLNSKLVSSSFLFEEAREDTSPEQHSQPGSLFEAKFSTILALESSLGDHIGSFRSGPAAFKGWLAVKRMQGAGTMWSKRFAVIRYDSARLFLYKHDPVLALLRYHTNEPVLHEENLRGATAKRANVDALVGCPTRHVRPLGLEVAAPAGTLVFGLICARDFPDAWLRSINEAGSQAVKPPGQQRALHNNSMLRNLGPPALDIDVNEASIRVKCNPSNQKCFDQYTPPSSPNQMSTDHGANSETRSLQRCLCLVRQATGSWEERALTLHEPARLLVVSSLKTILLVDLSRATVTTTCIEVALADLPVLSITDRRSGRGPGLVVIFPSHNERLFW